MNYFTDCSKSVGVENPAIIPDNHFTASSVYSSTYVPPMGRLNSHSGWAPKTDLNPNDYLQVDLGMLYVICALLTKGNAREDELVTEFIIRTSTDNSTWVPYQERGTIKVKCMKNK